MWVPAELPLSETWRADADLRTSAALPRADRRPGVDGAATTAIEGLARDLDAGVASTSSSRPRSTARSALVEDYTVAVINRGPAQLQRRAGWQPVPVADAVVQRLAVGCLDRPATADRAGWLELPVPALVAHVRLRAGLGAIGDWRAAGHGQARPRVQQPAGRTRLRTPTRATCPATTSLVRVEPTTVVLTALKPAGDPLARQAHAPISTRRPGRHADLRVGRLADRRHRPGASTVRERFADQPAGGGSRPADISDGAIALSTRAVRDRRRSRPGSLGATSAGGHRGDRARPGREPAQPVFADYWLHNKGPAPIGYPPVSVQIRPTRRGASGAVRAPDQRRVDAPTSRSRASVVVDVPPGWKASSSEQPISARAGCASGDRGECVARRCRARAVLRRRPDRRWRTGP